MNMITSNQQLKTPTIRIIKKQTVVAPEEFTFKKIDEQTLRLQFGEASFELKRDGAIHLKNSCAAISISANGAVHIEGADIKNKSKENIELDARKNIYLNSK